MVRQSHQEVAKAGAELRNQYVGAQAAFWCGGFAENLGITWLACVWPALRNGALSAGAVAP